MKPSGIEWIGDIPDDWEVRRLKAISKLQTGNTPSTNNKNNYAETGFPWLKPDDLCGTIKESQAKVFLSPAGKLETRILPANSILLCCIGSIGKIGFVSTECASNQQITALIIKHGFWRYFLYVLRIAEEELMSLSVGNVVFILNSERLGSLKIPFPPLKTQQKIADYLDEKCGEIDATIAKQKESIEKLKAYKQSLISETVTKGLDKSAPLKPSGIEWIGDIPAHWEVCKIKNHCNLKTGSTPSSKDLSMFDGAENWFTPSDFTENYMLKNSLRRLNAKVFDQNLVPIFPPLSVLIVGIGATTGKVGFTTSKSSSNQQITAIIPKDKNIFPKFLLFWMIANTKMIRETALFTTLPILNNDTLGNATLLIPPYKEQLELASYIENKNIEIDVIINKKQNIIQKLDTYKKSLIFECVTGKMFNLRRNL